MNILPVRSSPPRHRPASACNAEDDLSDVGIRLHPEVCPGDLRPSENGIDDRPEPPVREPGHRIGGEPSYQRDLPLPREVAERIPDDLVSSHEDPSEVQVFGG